MSAGWPGGPKPEELAAAGSCLALVVSGLTFAIRGDIIGDLGEQFQLTHEHLGWIASAGFWGFVLSIFVAGQFCDRLGMGLIIRLACLAHCSGVILTIVTTST